MSYLLSDPTTVLAVGDPETERRLRAVLVPSVAEAVVAVETAEDAAATLADRDDVGCVLVTDGAAAAPATVCEAVRDRDALVPVVVAVAPEAVDHATLAAVADCRYLPPSAGDDALADAVANALATYDERRDREAESSLFTTLLADAELSVFAKDSRGRHLYKADLEDDADPESVVGKTDPEVTPDYLRETARETHEEDLRVAETGEPIYDRVRQYDHEASDRWSEATKVPWYDDDGTVRGLVGYASDVTDRKRYERHLSEQAERIDQFITYVAHDLRTPLQVVYGEVDRARAGNEEALDGVETAVERIEHIVEDLSALSRRSDGDGLSSSTLRSLRADSLTTAFAPVVENVWTVLATDEATLELDVPEGTVVAVAAETLRPVVENLLKNALDHAGSDVTVRVGALDRGFFVEDDGPGVPEPEREAVTEAGYTTAEDGTGTGLAIVSETVDQQGWTLRVDDASDGEADPSATGGGSGARFEVAGVPMVTRPDDDLREGAPIALEANEDVGPVSIPGSADYDADDDEWTVVADGTNVWGNTHEFHYVHGEAAAPVRIRGRIAAFDGPEEFSKAGFAVRASADERAPFGYVGATESHGSEITWRDDPEGFTDSDQFGELPGTFAEYRVDYVDGRLTLALSETGEEWIPVDQRRLDLGDRVSLGMMVCSHSGKQTCEATFADVCACRLERE